MSRLWAIAYDIADDRRRRCIAAQLADSAERVQESVFEARLTAVAMRQLASRIEALMDTGADTLRCYPIIDDKRRQTLGCMPAAVVAVDYWLA